MALYGFEEDEAIPVALWSVQVPASMVAEVARPMAELCEPNVETE